MNKMKAKMYAAIVLSMVLIFFSIGFVQAEPLHILSSVWLDSFDRYISPAGERPVVSYEMETIEELINTNLLTQDSSMDLFMFCSYEDLYQIKRTGYYSPLNDSTALMDHCRQLYPAYQDLVTNEKTGDIVCWPMFSQPLVMTADMDLLNYLGVEMPETFEELIDACLAIDENEHYSRQDYSLLGGVYTFDKTSVLELYLDFYIMCGQQFGRTVNFETEDFIKNVTKIRECVPETDPSEGESRIFELAAAYESINTNMYPIPRVMADSENAVENLVVVAVINPYSQHKEEAIAYLEWCADQRTHNRYFSDSGLDEPMINPDMMTRKEQVENRLAQLRAAKESEEILRAINEAEQELEFIEKHLYLVTEKAITWYRENLAGNLFISEGKPIRYDQILDQYSYYFLKGTYTAEEYARACQEHINMVYAELQ